jgi:hypothetical protein
VNNPTLFHCYSSETNCTTIFFNQCDIACLRQPTRPRAAACARCPPRNAASDQPCFHRPFQPNIGPQDSKPDWTHSAGARHSPPPPEPAPSTTPTAPPATPTTPPYEPSGTVSLGSSTAAFNTTPTTMRTSPGDTEPTKNFPKPLDIYSRGISRRPARSPRAHRSWRSRRRQGHRDGCR